MDKSMESLQKEARTLSDSNARPSGSKPDSTVSNDLRSFRNYASTLDPARPSVGFLSLLLFVLAQIISSSCSLEVPSVHKNNPQPHARILHTELSTDNLGARTIQQRSQSCRLKVERKSLIDHGKDAPRFEVVRSGEDSELYLAQLSRNGISVSRPIPHEIYDDDFPDDQLAMFWLKIRRALASDLAEKESQQLSV